jgi:exonuclease VII small subunit
MQKNLNLKIKFRESFRPFAPSVIRENLSEYFEIDFTLSPNSKYRQAGAGSRSPREKEYGYAKILKKDFNGQITVKGENFNIGKDFITANLQTNKDNEVKPSEDELDAVIKRMEDEKAGEEAVMSQYDPMEESLNEAKKKDEKNYSVQQANPTELRLGIRTELEHGDMELDKAKEIAYKNIAKDPIYYTTLKLSGIEAHPKKVKGEKVAPAKKAKKESAQLVDLVNGMQKVKMPKADEKKKIKESVDEKMYFADMPADPEKYKIVKDSKGYIIKATNADGVEFQKGDVAKTYDGEEIKIAKFEESQGKVKAIYSTGMFFRGIDIDGLEAPKATFRPGVDIGGSFEKMKKSLEEIVRETISEYFDGRDNLVNPLSAEEENK